VPCKSGYWAKAAISGFSRKLILDGSWDGKQKASEGLENSPGGFFWGFEDICYGEPFHYSSLSLEVKIRKDNYYLSRSILISQVKSGRKSPFCLPSEKANAEDPPWEEYPISGVACPAEALANSDQRFAVRQSPLADSFTLERLLQAGYHS
jgi:hypothetical protein